MLIAIMPANARPAISKMAQQSNPLPKFGDSMSGKINTIPACRRTAPGLKTVSREGRPLCHGRREARLSSHQLPRDQIKTRTGVPKAALSLRRLEFCSRVIVTVLAGHRNKFFDARIGRLPERNDNSAASWRQVSQAQRVLRKDTRSESS